MNMETPGDPTPRQVEVSDLAAAALLMAEGCRLVDLVPDGEPGRKAFVLEGNAAAIESLLSAYERGKAVVAVEPFVTAQRRLKERLFRSERLGRGVRG